MKDTPQDSVELLPCPFCEAAPTQYHADSDDEGDASSIGCDRCSYYLTDFDHVDCIAAWNTRTASLTEQIEKLEAQVAELREALERILNDEDVALSRPDFVFARNTLENSHG